VEGGLACVCLVCRELSDWLYLALDKHQDTGIGMTEEDLIKNLGTIAHSGSNAPRLAFSNLAEN